MHIDDIKPMDIVATPYPPQVMPDQTVNIGKLTLALSKAQGEITGALKDSKNPFFKSNYADLASVWDACREHLSKNELAVIQTTDESSEGIIVITTLAHSSGEWIRGRIKLKPVKTDPQGMGSALTYGRRYGLAAIVGVAQIDDDAEAAQGRKIAQALKGNSQSIKAIKDHLAKNEIDSAAEAWAELSDEVRMGLNVAPSKGGPFTVEERKLMASEDFKEKYYARKKQD